MLNFPDAAINLHIALRWLHILAAITWVGLGYFFVLVNAPWQAQLDPVLRRQAAPPLMRRALWWFRWSSVATVFFGLWLWMSEIALDHRATAGASAAVWSFFLLWTLAYVLYMGMLMAPAPLLQRGPVVAVVTAVLVMAAAIGFLRLNAHGWETNRVLAIGIGGGIGWFMMLNVWGIVWRFQKRLLAWTAAGDLPPEAARLARLSRLAALTNAWLSLPMLFFMTAASHYPLFGSW